MAGSKHGLSSSDLPYTPTKYDQENIITEERINQNRERDRKNGIITKIDIPKDKLAQLNKLENSTNISSGDKRNRIKKILNGVCCVCHDVPVYLVSYPVDGGTRIERYCEKHITNVTQSNLM